MISKNIIRPTQIVINKNDIHDINISHMSSIISVLTISKTKLKNKITLKLFPVQITLKSNCIIIPEKYAIKIIITYLKYFKGHLFRKNRRYSGHTS